MRNRARPASLFSLLGIAVRIAQRMGLHRDGSSLGLTPFQSEERRRVWWQMQHMEIMISQILGTISLTLYANWDTKLPGNFEDSDIRPEMDILPTERSGLTSMSHCMWRYYILYYQRVPRQPDTQKDFASLTSPQVSLAAKVAFVEQFAGILNEKFVKYCELLNPLHVSIQIGTRGFILAMRRTVYQPRVAHAKISEIPKSEREMLLKICVECLEYYILAETTPSIAQFRWYNELYFQWTACKSLKPDTLESLTTFVYQLCILLSKHIIVLLIPRHLLSGHSLIKSISFTQNSQFPRKGWIL